MTTKPSRQGLRTAARLAGATVSAATSTTAVLPTPWSEILPFLVEHGESITEAVAYTQILLRTRRRREDKSPPHAEQ